MPDHDDRPPWAGAPTQPYAGWRGTTSAPAARAAHAVRPLRRAGRDPPRSTSASWGRHRGPRPGDRRGGAGWAGAAGGAAARGLRGGDPPGPRRLGRLGTDPRHRRAVVGQRPGRPSLAAEIERQVTDEGGEPEGITARPRRRSRRTSRPSATATSTARSGPSSSSSRTPRGTTRCSRSDASWRSRCPDRPPAPAAHSRACRPRSPRHRRSRAVPRSSRWRSSWSSPRSASAGPSGCPTPQRAGTVAASGSWKGSSILTTGAGENPLRPRVGLHAHLRRGGLEGPARRPRGRGGGRRARPAALARPGARSPDAARRRRRRRAGVAARDDVHLLHRPAGRHDAPGRGAAAGGARLLARQPGAQPGRPGLPRAAGAAVLGRRAARRRDPAGARLLRAGRRGRGPSAARGTATCPPRTRPWRRPTSPSAGARCPVGCCPASAGWRWCWCRSTSSSCSSSAWSGPPLGDLLGHGGALAVLLAASIGTVLVLPTAGEIPILLGLAAAGASAGVLGALLIALPAVSLPSAVMVGRALGWRTTAATAGATVVAGAGRRRRAASRHGRLRSGSAQPTSSATA